MDNLVILRNALLLTLLVMLVYVLYKRLIRLLRREHVQAKYPAMPNSIEWTPEGQARIFVELRAKMYLIVEIFDQHGNRMIQLAEGEFPGGRQIFTFERRHLIPGKYFYKVTSPHEEASQYFEIS
jgi:hypothetical protein